MRSPRGVRIALAAAVLLGSGAGSAWAVRPHASAKIDARVLADTAGGRTAHFLVVLERQADLDTAAFGTLDWRTRGRQVVRALRRAAADGRRGLIAELDARGVEARPYWIVNAVALEGPRSLANALAARQDVAAIEPDRAFRGVRGQDAPLDPRAPAGVEWNVARIGAPSVWQLGHTGQGLVYANADSGVVWDHPALRSRYRGWDGSAASHDRNWWDAVHSDIDGDGANPCGFDVQAPCDDDVRSSHGTHTMGTAVGDDGAGNQIGAAPGAKWIACRNMDQGVGRPSTYIECLQFFLAPTDLAGGNPDPDRRPHAVGNSYSCPPVEGCSIGSLQAAVDAMRAAGVFMAVSAGNEGPNCSTLAFPPAVYDSAVSVGAVDASDAIAPFSARGPVTADGSGRRKPDLVAPGVDIRSSARGGYRVLRGTSMASPHVGGAVLLLWSAFPSLRGDVDRTEAILEESAVRLTTVEGCGGDTPSSVPNNTFGHGRLDVAAAYGAAEGQSPPAASVDDVSAAEGDAGTKDVAFTVALERASARGATVAYRTLDGSATAPGDYRAASGTLSFAPGEARKTIAVTVVGDTLVEPDETFGLALSAPANAALGRAQARATIKNDDVDRTPPVVSFLTVRPEAFRARAGAVVRFVLSEAAAATFTVDRVGPRARVGSLSRAAKEGRNAFRLSAAALGRRLAPGGYRLTVVARDRARNRSRPAAAGFRVVP